jgi:hypothetical protein
MSGLGVDESLRWPRILRIIPGIPEMIVSHCTSNFRLTFAQRSERNRQVGTTSEEWNFCFFEPNVQVPCRRLNVALFRYYFDIWGWGGWRLGFPVV